MQRTRTRVICLATILAIALPGAAGLPVRASGVLDPVTSRGQSISNLFLLTLVLAAIIMIAIGAVLAYILIRFRHRPDGAAPYTVGHEHRIQIAWIAGMVALFVLFGGLMLRTMRIVGAPAPANAVTVQIIGHQWWWEVRYPAADVVTANEIHVPVDTPLKLEILGDDVIHSFWVPDIGWKMDGIPGKTNTMAAEIDRAGIYEGACTEFCGAQHAWMRLRFYAEPPDQYQAWLAAQQQPSISPSGSIERQGLAVFLEHTCISCHRVRFADGSATEGGVGPDLTHFGSRDTIGAGMLANTPENLRAWIAAADDVKPHVLMPRFDALSDADLDALVRYLEGLA